jgi:hypothetical protein
VTKVEEDSVRRVIAMAFIREITTLRIRVWDGGDGFVLDFPDIPYTTVPKKGETTGAWLERLKSAFRIEFRVRRGRVLTLPTMPRRPIRVFIRSA